MSVSVPLGFPPTHTPPFTVDENGKLKNELVAPWLQWLVALWTAVRAPAITAVPANSSAVGVPGQLAYDQNFLYVCVGAKLWKRLPLSSF